MTNYANRVALPKKYRQEFLQCSIIGVNLGSSCGCEQEHNLLTVHGKRKTRVHFRWKCMENFLLVFLNLMKIVEIEVIFANFKISLFLFLQNRVTVKF